MAKLIINDEVSIKIENLPLPVRKKLSNTFRFFSNAAKFHPAYKLGRWDGYTTFFSIGGVGCFQHLESILNILSQFNIEITEVEDKRHPINLKFDTITETYWSDMNKTWPPGHERAGELITLRDYQVNAINTFLKNPQSIQVIATGAGKTLITATMSHICEQYGNTLTIVPNTSLVEQTEENYLNVGLDVGVYFGDRKDLTKTHTICTWQGLGVLAKRSKFSDPEFQKLTDFLPKIKTVIIDETHAAKASVLKTLLTQQLKFAPIRWGLTGTMPKDKCDNESIITSIGPIVGGIKAHVLQEQNVLANCDVRIIQLMDTKVFTSYPDENRYLVTDPDRIKYICSMLTSISDTGNTLILVNRIKTGSLIQDSLINDFGISDINFISGEVKTKDRKSEYNDFKIQDNKITIATYGVAAVGIDIVRIHNLVLLEPGKSFIRVIQSIGRGLRKGSDKDHVEIYDIASCLKYSKRHLKDRKDFYREAQYPFSITKIAWEDK